VKSKKTIKTTWDLSPLFKNDNDPEIEKERKILVRETNKFVNKWKTRNDYLEEPKVLKEALDEYEEWCSKWGTSGKQGYYFGLRSAQDQSDPKIKAESNKLSDISTKLLNEIEFFWFTYI
jgi:oligoendopeptidase F